MSDRRSKGVQVVSKTVQVESSVPDHDFISHLQWSPSDYRVRHEWRASSFKSRGECAKRET